MASRSISSQRISRSSPYNLQIAVGTYTGDGTDNRNITSVGFQPDFVLVKGGINVAVWRSYWTPGDSTCHLASATANIADAIQSLLSNGFQVGTNATVNSSGTTYYWIAIRGNSTQNYFRTGIYKGSANNPMFWSFPIINFTPDVLWCKRDSTSSAEWWNSSMPVGNSTGFENRGLGVGAFSSVYFSGFQTGGSTRVNQNGSTFYYFSLKNVSGIINSGTYTGNGQDNRNITGIGFQPDVVWIKGNLGVNGYIRTSDFSGDSSADFGGVAPAADRIQSFISDGFQIGTQGNVNTNNIAYFWVALKAGNYNFPITRSTASGRTAV